MVKVYVNRGDQLKMYFGFDKTSKVPEGFTLLLETTDVYGASIAASAILLMEADMTYDTPGAVDFCRDNMVNFQEIGTHMAAYELGKAMQKMLKDANVLCGTEAK